MCRCWPSTRRYGCSRDHAAGLSTARSATAAGTVSPPPLSAHPPQARTHPAPTAGGVLPAPPPYYPPPPGPYAPPAPGTNWWAIVSLIFGLIGGVLISVVCGIVGLQRAKKGQGGRGMAIAGLVLSGLWVLGIVAVVRLPVALRQGHRQRHRGEGGRLSQGTARFRAGGHRRHRAVRRTAHGRDLLGDDDARRALPRPVRDRGVPEQVRAGAGEVFARGRQAIPRSGCSCCIPVEDSWGQGDRTVTCIATTDTPRTGTLKK